MDRLLYEYELHPTTWVYLASLLAVTVYFRFSPLIRWRNVDIIGLIALGPGLVLLRAASTAPTESLAAALELAGQVWLLSVGLFFVIRLLCDPMMVRRPMLEPNLNTGGLTFLGLALLVFLSLHVILGKNVPTGADTALLQLYGGLPGILLGDASSDAITLTTRITFVVAQVALVIGLMLVGYRHFQNFNTGVAVATLYLMLPGTALTAGRADMALTGALLVWMTLSYRNPLFAGAFLGAAYGAVYYPIFLLPLWCAFYWSRGLLRFLSGFFVTVLLVAGTLGIVTGQMGHLFEPTIAMFGWTELVEGGLWGPIFAPAYRIPVQVAFFVMCISFALWPVRKNLGTLLSCSAAVMLGTQFWHVQGGGHLAWYLPLLLLTVFRPNLEDRVALSVLGDGWFRPRLRVVRENQAA